jgi:hypothetical protein
MCRCRLRMRTCAVALASLMVAAGGAGGAGLYEYRDDFSTNKVEVDSYFHSAILDEVPPYVMSGVLVYYDRECHDRNLAFIRGYDPGFPFMAHLAYCFPLDGPQGVITDCQVGFTVCPSSIWGGGFGDLALRWSTDGEEWTVVDTVDKPGDYHFQLAVPDTCQQIYVRFDGEWVLFDDLNVSLSINDAAGAAYPPVPRGGSARGVRCRVSPSPFSDQAVFTYCLPAAQSANLDIFDSAGKKVRSFHEQWQAEGTHSLTWNGSGLSSGLYHYRLRCRSGTATGNCLLLR